MEIESLKSESQKTVESKDTEIRQQKEILYSMTAELENEKSQNVTLQERVTSLTTGLNTLYQQLQELDQTTQSYWQQNLALQNSVAQLQQGLWSANTRLTETGKAYSDLKNENSKLKNQLEIADTDFKEQLQNAETAFKKRLNDDKTDSKEHLNKVIFDYKEELKNSKVEAKAHLDKVISGHKEALEKIKTEYESQFNSFKDESQKELENVVRGLTDDVIDGFKVVVSNAVNKNFKNRDLDKSASKQTSEITLGKTQFFPQVHKSLPTVNKLPAKVTTTATVQIDVESSSEEKILIKNSRLRFDKLYEKDSAASDEQKSHKNDSDSDFIPISKQ